VECVCNGSSDASVACASPLQLFCVYAYDDDGGDARDGVSVCGDVLDVQRLQR
jgi:hypothetical protein